MAVGPAAHGLRLLHTRPPTMDNDGTAGKGSQPNLDVTAYLSVRSSRSLSLCFMNLPAREAASLPKSMHLCIPLLKDFASLSDLNVA